MNPQMAARTKRKATASVDQKLARLRPSYRSKCNPARNESGRLMREGLKETAEVALGWLSEPVQKVIDVFHLVRGSAKIARALEQEGRR